MQRRVKGLMVDALLNMLRYLSANCCSTASVTSRKVEPSAPFILLSLAEKPSLLLRRTEPEPTSPSTENCTKDLLQLTETVSLIEYSSLQSLEKSEEGTVTRA